jgi:hypothetical protein
MATNPNSLPFYDPVGCGGSGQQTRLEIHPRKHETWTTVPKTWLHFGTAWCKTLPMLAKVCSAAVKGIEAYPVEVEVRHVGRTHSAAWVPGSGKSCRVGAQTGSKNLPGRVPGWT